jgi:hypothetical protein
MGSARFLDKDILAMMKWLVYGVRMRNSAKSAKF